MVTKQAILKGAYRLMMKRSLDKITVTDIAKECQITRQTFYYHFQDILAMVEWGVQNELDRLVQKSEHAESMEDVLLLFCRSVMEKKTVFSKIIESRYNLQLLHMMSGQVREYMVKLMYQRAENEEKSVKDMIFLVEYHSGAITFMLSEWLQKKDVDMEEGIVQIAKVVRGELHA